MLCVCVPKYVHAQAYVHVFAVAPILSMCVTEIVELHFPRIRVHDFPDLCSHPRQLSPTLLRFLGHLAFTCLLSGILSPYLGLDT